MSANPAFLLDTNILSDLLRNPAGRVARKIATVGESNICTSIIVASELRYGAEKSRSRELTERVALILSALQVLSFDEPADRRYGEIRAELARRGRTIGPNDLLIAGHALALDCVVVTDYQREFRRVPGLTTENWLRS